MSKKKELKIPRIWVYLAAFGTGVVLATLFGMVFGLESALTFMTTSAIYSVLTICSYNVFDKVNRQPYRLTWRYWTLIGMIVVTDFLFLFLAKAPDAADGKFRAGLFVAALIGTICFAYYTYRPEQIAIFAQVKEKAAEEIAQYLNDHNGEDFKVQAEGIIDMMMAPKKKEEPAAPEGEEAHE